MKKVIVTGPTGAVGCALIKTLIDHQIYVKAVCRPGSKRIKNIPKSDYAEIVECDLDHLTQLPAQIKERGFDAFYHFAWEGTIGSGRNDTDLQLQNVKHTLDAVKAAKELGCRRFIGSGSQAEYGRYEGKLNASVPVFPENGYGIAKLCAGQMSRLLCSQLGMEHIWTRILSVYGPCDGPNTMIMSAIHKLLNGETPSFTKGEQKWDYLYSEDAGNAMYLIGEKGISGKIYCIGSGNAKPLADYIRTLGDAIDPQAKLGIGDIPYGDKQVMFLCADITELQKDTGFSPQYSFDKGIRKTIQWVKEQSESGL